jgi:hypothetical protein
MLSVSVVVSIKRIRRHYIRNAPRIYFQCDACVSGDVFLPHQSFWSWRQRYTPKCWNSFNTRRGHTPKAEITYRYEPWEPTASLSACDGSCEFDF